MDQVLRRLIIPEDEGRASRDSRGPEPTSNTVAAFMLFAVIALAPLPFGSVDPLPILAWCLSLGMALCAASLRSLDARHFLIPAGVAIVVIAYLVVLHEQVAQRPWFALARPDPVWQAASDALGAPLPESLSLVRGQPILSLGAPLACILCLLVSFIVCIERRRAYQLLDVVAWSGAAYAVYGIAAFLIEPGKVLWMQKQAYFTVLTATFINRNTAAVYFGACATVWLLILVERVRRRLPRAARPSWIFIARTVQGLRRDSVAGFLAFFFCCVAMFLTGSRAGVLLSLLVGGAALAPVVWKLMRFGWKSVGILTTAACTLLVVIQLLGAGVIGRLDNEGFAGGGRLETYRSTLTMIGDHPWLGTGQGTFALVYPSYRSNAWTSWGIWDRAHSTPLEIASDMGLPLAAIVIAGWAAIFAVLGFGLWSRKRDQIIVIAALATGALGVLHSLIDFSLQIPGFAMVVFALVGAGLAQSFRKAQPSSSASKLRPGLACRRTDR